MKLSETESENAHQFNDRRFENTVCVCALWHFWKSSEMMFVDEGE
jgi:hypothetical protein